MAVFLIFSLCTSENIKHPATLMKWIQYPASKHELSSLEIKGAQDRNWIDKLLGIPGWALSLASGILLGHF